MNELDRYAVSLENMEVLWVQIAEQAREIAVLKANVVTDNSMVLVNALAELERLKAQSGAVVPASVVWIDAHHIQPGNNPSFIRDVALVSAVKTTETQVPLVRLNQPASAGAELVRHMVPDGWSVERVCSPSGYVLHSPGGSMIRVCDSGMGGIETAFAMFLKAMLAAAPSTNGEVTE